MLKGSEQTLHKLQPGDHVCPLHETLSEQLSVAAQLIHQGLHRGERCLYITEDVRDESIAEHLRKRGIDWERQLASESLQFVSTADSMLDSGRFEPQKMLKYLSDSEQLAIDQGLSGLCVIGNMHWVIAAGIPMEVLIEYEALLNKYLADRKTTIFCQYHLRRRDPTFLLEVLRTHPKVVLEDTAIVNPFCESPDLLLNTAPHDSIELKKSRSQWSIQQLRSLHAAMKDSTQKLASSDSSDRVQQNPDIKYQTLLNQIPIPLFVFNPNTLDYLFVNEAVVTEYGYSREEFERMKLPDIRPPEEVPLLLEALTKPIEKYEHRGFWHHRRKDGSIFLAEIHTNILDLEGSPACIVLARDVTEQKKAEEELRLRDRAIRTLSQGIVITDSSLPDNPITYVNPGFEKLTGYSAHEVLGKNCRLLQGEETSSEAVDRLRDSIAQRLTCTVELLNYRKDGTPFWNEVSIAPVHDDQGMLTHFIGIQTDVTAKRKLEEQLRQSQKMEAIGQLAGGIAHDFNNLLTVIMGYSNVLLDSTHETDPSREMILEINQAAQRSATLTRQLLAFGRKQILSPQVLNLNKVVKDTQRMLHRVLGEDIQLVADLAEDLGSVRVDVGQLEQVLINLSLNARDAMPQGGTLSVKTRNVTLDDTHLETDQEVQPGQYVMLAVTDSGCGMPHKVRQRVFEPFFTTKEVGKGTGLGMAVVHGFVKQSGGHISVYSEPDVGTIVKIYLPNVSETAPQKSASQAQLPAPGGTETILLVEDEAPLRALVKRVLHEGGYTVLEAAHGKEALQLANQHSEMIQLLVTDVVMPHMGGRELAEELLRENPEMKVIFVSGYTDDSVVPHGISQAAVNFLEKPFSPLQLAQMIRTVLDEK